MQPDLFAKPEPTAPAAPHPTLRQQDAFSIRTVARGLRIHLARPGIVQDGGPGFTLPGLLSQAAAWTGASYYPHHAARAADDLDALALAADAAPSMTSAEAIARMGGSRRRRR